MNERELDALTEQVWRRLVQQKPRALLLGAPPIGDHNFNYVNKEPYEAVVLGDLPPGELLRMPTDPVCRALLSDMPVYLSPVQSYKRAGTARLLCAELAAAERHLRQLGARPLGAEADRLVTAAAARRLLESGSRPPAGSRLTPLARDILEGKES